MTAASSGSTAATDDAGPRPRLLTAAAILLGVTAILGLLLPLSLYTQRDFVSCSVSVASANATPTATVSGTPTPQPKVTPRATTNSEIKKQFDGCLDGTGPVGKASDPDTSNALSQGLISGLFPLVVCGGLAFAAFRGVPLTRWFLVGAWVLSNVIRIIPFSLIAATGVFASTAPALYIVIFALGFLAFTAAAVLVNLPSVTRYLNARRPVRTAATRSGGGGLFGPRPPRAAPASGPTSSSSRVSMDKPASSAPANPRPANKGKGSGGSGGGTGNTGRAKGKRRG